MWDCDKVAYWIETVINQVITSWNLTNKKNHVINQDLRSCGFIITTRFHYILSFFKFYFKSNYIFQQINKRKNDTANGDYGLNPRLLIRFFVQRRERDLRERNVQTRNLEKVSATSHNQVSRMLLHVGE